MGSSAGGVYSHEQQQQQQQQQQRLQEELGWQGSAAGQASQAVLGDEPLVRSYPGWAAVDAEGAG
jgi:hypothetical protein